MSDTTSTTPPTCIGNFMLNARDLVRVDLDTFKGRNIVSLRKWFLSEGGEVRPTAKGLSVAVEHLPKLAALANEALARARAEGLLPQEGRRDG